MEIGARHSTCPPRDPGAFDLTVEGKNKIVVHDVMVGEVWLASGQSNMAFLLEKQTDSAEEIADG